MNECIMRFRQKEDYMSARVYTPFVQVVRQRPKLDYILYGYSRKKHREWKHIKQKLCIFLTRSSSEATEEAEKEKSLNSSSVCISLITSSGQSSLSCVYVVLFLNESIEPSPWSSLFWWSKDNVTRLYYTRSCMLCSREAPEQQWRESEKKSKDYMEHCLRWSTAGAQREKNFQHSTQHTSPSTTDVNNNRPKTKRKNTTREVNRQEVESWTPSNLLWVCRYV